jgi:hypothetical protein
MLGSHQSPVRSQLPQAGIGSSLGDNGRDQSTLVEVLVLLVRVKDEQNTYIPLVSHFEELFNGNGRGATNPAGYIRQYLRYSSLEKYNVQFVIRDWAMYQKQKNSTPRALCLDRLENSRRKNCLEMQWK